MCGPDGTRSTSASEDHGRRYVSLLPGLRRDGLLDDRARGLDGLDHGPDRRVRRSLVPQPTVSVYGTRRPGSGGGGFALAPSTLFAPAVDALLAARAVASFMASGRGCHPTCQPLERESGCAASATHRRAQLRAAPRRGRSPNRRPQPRVDGLQPSDPGVTLVELFAFLADTLLWQIDERQRQRRRQRRRRVVLVVVGTAGLGALWLTLKKRAEQQADGRASRLVPAILAQDAQVTTSRPIGFSFPPMARLITSLLIPWVTDLYSPPKGG